MKSRRLWPMSMRKPVRTLLCIPLLLTACDSGKPKAKLAPKHKVEVADAVAVQVPLTKEFVGTTAAIKLVEIRAKVQGYLEERSFTEGTDVKKGDILFVIDQRPFQANVEKFKAELEQKQAKLTFAQQQLVRYKKLAQDSFASVQKYESMQSNALQAASDVAASQADLKNAELALQYTTIIAPIDGRISNTQVNIGNLVSSEETLLTTLVQLDPIYVYFSPSEAVYHEIAPYQAKEPLKVSMVLASGAAYPREGTVDFVDNRVETSTGTIKMRAVLPNPEKTQRPGQYVKVNVILTEHHDAILVPAQAVAEDEAGHYLFVVDKDDKLERRNVKLGRAHKDRYVIDDGVKAGEQVVVKGLQKVHGGEQVEVTQSVKTGAETAKNERTGTGNKGGDKKRAGPSGQKSKSE